MAPPTIVGIGGFPDDALVDYALGLARGRRALYVPTAQMEDPAWTVEWYGRLHGRAEMTPLRFNPWPPAGLRELALAHDVILVPGGNTANMLAIWRAHGFDRILREAWEAGVVLCGWSAGMICWFEASVTDSFGPQLAGMRDGLGFLPGSACPHYDGEERRRPVYTGLVRDGFPPGLALDDHAAARFDGAELVELVATAAGARGTASIAAASPRWRCGSSSGGGGGRGTRRARRRPGARSRSASAARRRRRRPRRG